METLCTYMPVSRKQACSSETVKVKLSKALPMKRMAPCDDCIGLLQKVGASEKKKGSGLAKKRRAPHNAHVIPEMYLPPSLPINLPQRQKTTPEPVNKRLT